MVEAVVEPASMVKMDHLVLVWGILWKLVPLLEIQCQLQWMELVMIPPHQWFEGSRAVRAVVGVALATMV